jgi:hypothetical protein
MGVIIVYAPTRFEMSDASRWVRARVIAVMLWAVFVVGFTVLPLAAVFFLVRFGGSRPGADLLLGDGQAFLVVAAIGADALGRIVSGLWARRTSPGVFQLFLLLTCVILVVLSTVQFMSVLSLRSQKQAVDMDFLIEQSKGFSIAALLAGFGAILVVDE